MKRILPLLLAVAALSARGNVLVYEGFHPADYNNVGDNTQMTPSANVSTNYSVGFAAGNWSMNGSQPKVYGANYGLALPSEMTAADFSALGGSIGLNPDGNNAALRSTSHALVADTLKVSSGTLYLRMLLTLDAKAAGKLVSGASLANKDGGYYGFGLTTGDQDYYLLTATKSSIAFVVWKNSSNQYVLSLAHTTAAGTAFTSYPILTDIAVGTTYLCYAEIQVGAGTDGKEILRAGAMAVDAFTTDTPWAALDGASDSVEVELMTESSYPTRIAVAGPYGTNGGRFRADELLVGTELSDILLGSTTKPKLSDGSLALANGTYTVSASLTNSAATVSYVLSNGTIATTNAIATYADGDTVAGTFAAPADDTTYEVILTAMNAGDETAELSLGTIYGGSLSLGAATDANETGLVAGGVTVSRAAADPLPLTVNYTISGSAGSEGATWAAPVAVTIPAGSASAVLPVTPISDPDVTEDVTITVSLAAGNYGLPSANAATLTLVNHRAAVPADFAKKITLTPSETALAKIGETAWTDFPVLVRLPAEASAQLQSANGTDLYVTDENDSALPFEVDTFDPAGETLVWVKVPSLSAATALTVYFGGAANADNDPTAVWTDYVGVWHMSEASGAVADATGHGLDAAPAKATAVSVAQANGAVGTARQTATSGTKDYLTIPNYDAQGVGADFTFACWYDATERKSYDRLVSRKKSYGDGNGWEVEMANSNTKLSARGASDTSISGSFSDIVSSGWMRFAFVYSGTSLTAYLNGAQIGTGTIKAATDNGYPLSIGCDSDGSESYFVGHVDEARLRKGAVSAEEVALEHATMADAAFFDAGAVEDVDETAQKFETPTVVRNANGTYTVTVVLSENSGDVGVVYDAGATAVTNLLATAAAPGTFADTPANLTADTTYAFAAYGKNANGTEVAKEGGAFYNGELTVEKVSDAAENGLVPGVFRISRADTAHDLVVSYTVGGTATAGQTYAALSGTATIPAGSTHVDVEVVPLLDSATTENTTVSLALAAGLYGVDAQAGSAEMTVENLVVPAGFNTWVAAADGLASVGSNWSEGHAPLASENVLFDGRFSSANCEWDAAATATVASWTMQNDYAGAVTVDTVFPGKGDFQCLTVTGAMTVNAGSVTHPQSRTMAENHNAAWDWLGDLLANETYRLRLDVGSLAVGADGLLDAKGKGYLATHDAARVNASHGGRISDASPRCYGDPKEPIHIGLPDRPAGNYYNGVGGGAIYVTSAGAVVVDGVVRADSAGRDYGNNNHACGAAGSVYIQAASVSGTGTISAYGPGSADGNYKGTGGRVAIVTEQPVDRSTFASINADSARRNAQNNIANRFGGVGTVFFRDATMTHGVLVVASAETTYEAVPRDHRTDVSADGDWTFDRVELGGNVQLAVPVGKTLTLPGWNCVTVPGNTAGTPSGLFYEGGTLAFGSAADVTLAGHWYFAPVSNYVFNANVALADGATIGFGGKYTQNLANYAYPVDVDTIHCTVNGDLTVPAGCAVNVNLAGAMLESHNVPAGYPQGAHGGRRSNTMKTIGSVFHPRTLPHGQSNSYGWIIPGGAVELVVSGTLTLGGTIESTAYTGNDGTKSEVGGGSIDITAGRLAGDGSIKAGAVKDGQPGGRIAIRLTGAGATLDDFDGTINCATMGANSVGSCGSVYIQTAADGDGRGTVILDDNNVTCTTYTPICATGYAADDVADFRHADLVVRNQAKAQVSVADANGAFRMDGLEIDETGALDLSETPSSSPRRASPARTSRPAPTPPSSWRPSASRRSSTPTRTPAARSASSARRRCSS